MNLEGIIAGTVAGSITGAAMLGWNWLNAQANERNISKIKEARDRLGDKILRHAPSGKVGRVVAIGGLEPKRFGAFNAKIVGILVTNDILIPASFYPPMMLNLIQEGRILMVPINELAAALPEEVEAYTA